jgi:hypothetical protein
MVHDLQGADGAGTQEPGDGRLARLRERDRIAQRGEARRELMIVEQDPAPDLAPLIVIRGPGLARDFGGWQSSSMRAAL